MDIFEEIRKRIDWYNSNFKTLDIDKLVTLKTSLVNQNYYLAELVAEFKYNHTKSYFLKKYAIARKKNVLIKLESAAKAEIIANKETLQQLLQELKDEAAAYKAELLYRHVNRIIDDIKDRMIYLYKEQKHAEEE